MFRFLLLVISSFLCFVPVYAQTQQPSINPQLLQKPWQALWIAPLQSPLKEYGVYHFRKSISLPEKPASFVVHVSADNRYKLYVNGQFVCLGPARGELDHWSFETVDIAPYLQAGKNTIASVVWNWGEHMPYAQMTYQTGFIMQGNSEVEKSINTDASWRVIQNKAYQPVVFAPNDKRMFWQYYVAGALDSVSAVNYPWEWQNKDFDDSSWQPAKVIGPGYPPNLTNPNHWTLVPRAIPLMENKKQRFVSIRRSEGVQVTNDFLTDKTDITIPANTKATLLLDQQVLTIGYPELVVSGGKGSQIKQMYAEALFNETESKKVYQGIKGNRNDIEGYQMYGIYDHFTPDGGNNRTFSPLWWRTFRYVQLEIQTAAEPLKLHDMYSYFSAYPFTEKATFASSDPQLSKMWEVGWRTARLCAHETYMDCPYYEQLQYYGDTRIQALISLYVSGDDRLMRNAIQLGDYSRIPEGITHSRYPSELPQFSPLFSICWALMVKDYWMHRRDDAFVQSFLPGMRGVFAWFEQKKNAQGMIEGLPYLDFVDSQYPRDEIVEKSQNKSMAVHTLFYAYGLEQLAPLFEHYGAKEEANMYRAQAVALKETTNKHCYDTNKKLFADTPDKQSFSQHANVMAVLTNAVSKQEQIPLLEKTLADTSLIKCATYFQFYLFRAMKEAGLGNRYLAQLTPWRNMLANNLSTFSEWEVNPRSDCHAWSASPNYDMLATVCGIEPASPGFKTVNIQPHLGNLTFVKVNMPHPDGEIAINIKLSGKSMLRGTVTLPLSVSGKFIWNGKEIVLKGGTQKIEAQ